MKDYIDTYKEEKYGTEEERAKGTRKAGEAGCRPR